MMIEGRKIKRILKSPEMRPLYKYIMEIECPYIRELVKLNYTIKPPSNYYIIFGAYDLIRRGFSWRDSDEGIDFWDTVWEDVLNNQQKTISEYKHLIK